MRTPTSPTTDRGDPRAGFTLVELMLALAVMAIVAGLALPFVRIDESYTGLRAQAYQAAALLRADRAAALRSGRTVVAVVDFPGPRLRSGATGEVVDLSRGLAVRASGLRQGGVAFYPDGRSSGGALALATRTARIDVEIDAVTSSVSIRPKTADER